MLKPWHLSERKAAIYHVDDDDVDTVMSLMLAQDLHLHHNNAAMKEIYILNYKLHKICITDFMSHQIWKSSIHKRICWNETRRKRRKNEKMKKLILTILH